MLEQLNSEITVNTTTTTATTTTTTTTTNNNNNNKVKWSRKRPDVAGMVPGVLGSLNSITFGI
jgi:hypothetical protein